MTDDDYQFGKLTVAVGTGKAAAKTVYTLGVDRLACARDGTMYLLGVVGPQGSVKSLRAALNAKVPADYAVEGVRMTDGQTSGHAKGFHAPDGGKYDVHAHPLGFGQVHALFVSRTPGFLVTATDESVYACLKGPEYTTPLLRAWAEAVKDDLRGKGLLTPLFGFRCQCSILTATDADLDASVSEGVKSGKLLFRELNLVGDAA